MRAKRNPAKAPMNNEGAKVPPHPPPPLVEDVAMVFVRRTKVT